MLRTALAALALSAVIATAATIAAASSVAPAPSLRLSRSHPVVVRGHGFRPGERVRVSLRDGAITSVVHRRASVHGGFVATFRASGLPHCGGFAIVATGSDGSRAQLVRRNLACPAP